MLLSRSLPSHYETHVFNKCGGRYPKPPPRGSTSEFSILTNRELGGQNDEVSYSDEYGLTSHFEDPTNNVKALNEGG